MENEYPNHRIGCVILISTGRIVKGV